MKGGDTPSSRKVCCMKLFDSSTGSRLAYLETPEGGTRSSSHRGGRMPSRVNTVAVARTLGTLPGVTNEKTEPLTVAQKEQLEAELAELEGPRRAEAVEAIASARSFGDLSENFEYHAAKNEQGLLERRIALLRDRLDRAVLIDEAAEVSDVVTVGARVEIEDESGERMEIEISSVGGVSPDSPVGQALLGRRVGDEVEIQAPRRSWRARILSVGR
jgi:transcription elongation factor GreA